MLKNFQETDSKKKIEMQKQLNTAALKLEKIQSLWYFITSSSGKVIAGSKG